MIPLCLKFKKVFEEYYNLWCVHVATEDVDSNLNNIEHSHCFIYKNQKVFFEVPDFLNMKRHEKNDYYIYLKKDSVRYYLFDTEHQADDFIYYIKDFTDHFNNQILKSDSFYICIKNQFTLENNS